MGAGGTGIHTLGSPFHQVSCKGFILHFLCCDQLYQLPRYLETDKSLYAMQKDPSKLIFRKWVIVVVQEVTLPIFHLVETYRMIYMTF